MNITNLSLSPSARIEGPDEASDLHRLIAVFRRRMRILLAVALVVLATVMIITFQITPRYLATATVMIDTRKHDISNIEAVVSDLPPDSSIVDTEVEILKSRTLAERVVSALGLDNDPEFNAQLRPTPPLVAVLGAPFKLIGDAFKKDAPATSPEAQQRAEDIRRQKVHEAVVDQVLQRLKVRRSGLTYVINVGFESESPAKSAQIANAFADKYLLEQLEAKYDAAEQATQWLSQRLAELQPQVEQAEASVQQYKAQHGLLASVGSTLTEQEISNLNTELDQARADAAEKDARVRTAQQEAQAGSNGGNLTGALSSQTMMQLRSQQAAASSKVADLQTKYGPRHPEVQRAERELADITAQINQEISRDVANLQTEDNVARQRVASLEASLSGAKGTLVGNNAASVELADLQRRADAASALYDSLLNREKQTSVDQGSEQSDSRVVSHAKIPVEPSVPNKELSLALGVILGLACGVGAVFLTEMLDIGLTTSEDVERYFNLPHLGAVPLFESTTHSKPKDVSASEYIVSKPLSAFAEAFRNLRASILFSKVDEPVRVVAVTSALPGEGKTMSALCLGKSMGLSGVNVIVVDCDLRRRSVSKLMGARVEAGLVEVLQGATNLDDALIRDEATGAWFLPLAKTLYTPKDLFGSAAMDRLLAQLRERFDFVILDTAPLLPVSDTRILAPKADVVVFLAQWRKTPRKAIEAALGLLTSAGADIAGIALTLVDVRELAKYGYGDSGYYYHRYNKYYVQ